jgi:hypothetical protein
MGLRSDHVAARSDGLGHTPIVHATGQRFGCNMISAITNRGHLAFMVVHGMFGGRLFGRFLWRLLKQAASKPYLIIDGHPVHRSAVATRFVAANETRPSRAGKRGQSMLKLCASAAGQASHRDPRTVAALGAACRVPRSKSGPVGPGWQVAIRQDSGCQPASSFDQQRASNVDHSDMK